MYNPHNIWPYANSQSSQELRDGKRECAHTRGSPYTRHNYTKKNELHAVQL